MDNSFRNKLYLDTKPQHEAVEEVFNFKNEVNTKNLHLFLCTMLVARVYCQPLLGNLETNFGIDTYNTALIRALQEDLGANDLDLDAEMQKLQGNLFVATDISSQIGAFYVFAGSSSGAKVILSLARKQGIQSPLYYFTELVGHSKNQMNTLKKIITQGKFVDDQVIESAQHTFDLIYKIASNELRKRTTAV
ncbi:hypothetical protein KIM67_03345 [Flagellimonas sp. 389]|uniref:hypothetical protein n=1 Tax=Flagellimonas sp. 389 TaxID=2835862 RepID=UPI001BD5CCAE|nr:hypothetical protein [Flagellimonas sp. 389]MBS9461431.1 hypothetical protein [Flagellimonas sp. 389]